MSKYVRLAIDIVIIALICASLFSGEFMWTNTQTAVANPAPDIFIVPDIAIK